MRVLIYKRTHKGDPDETGIFGIEDCMGRVRDWNYDAVIGIGGKRPWKEDADIKQKINWVGIQPKKVKSNGRASCVVFAHFVLFEDKGQVIETKYPNLFRHMYHSRKRFDMSRQLPEKVYEEVKEILKLAEKNGPSNEFDVIEVKFQSNRENEPQFSCGKGNKKCEVTIDDYSI